MIEAGSIDGTAALRAAEQAIGGLVSVERIEARAVVELVRFDEADVAAFLGYTGLVRYLEVEAGLSPTAAIRLSGLVRHCRGFPLTAKALDVGDITIPYVEVLARAAQDMRCEYERDEHELLGLVEGRDVATFSRALANWRHRQETEAVAAEAERAFERRHVSLQRSFDGSGTGRFRLDPIATDLLEAALDTQPDPTTSAVACRSLGQRRADALVDMAGQYLNRTPATAGAEPTGTRHGNRGGVDVVIDLQTLERQAPHSVATIRAELATGAPVPLPVIDQLLCDASYRRLVMDGPSVVLDYGTATPDIPVGLRRAVQRRDRRCQFQGCDRSWLWCDVHHLTHRRDGGPTSERNLALVCRFHHTLIHQVGWILTRDPTTGQLHTTSP